METTTYFIGYSDGQTTRLQAVNVDQARNRGYRFNPSGTIVDVHEV